MQLDIVRPLFDRTGPYLSLHLDVSRATEDARQQLEARWNTARRSLEGEEISAEVLEDIGARLQEPTGLPGEVWRTIVATRDEVLLDQFRAGHSTWPESVAVGPLPDLAGWLSLTDGQVPLLLVRVDRSGADIEAYVAPSRPVAEERTVEGEDYQLTKIDQGGWAQDKYQQRAENLWEANAKEVADEITSMYRRLRPRLIVLAGDVRARTDLAGLLGDLQGASVQQVESGGRAAGTSDESLWEDVRRLLAELEAHRIDDLLQRIQRGLAVGEGVVHGVDRVADALVKGEVEQLVLSLDDARAVTVSAADHPGLALPQSALEAGTLPADQVLLAAAALTGAEAVVLPTGVPLPRELTLANGTVALLRWDDRRPQQPPAG